MKILEISLNKLKPNNYNPNEMDPQKVEQLKKTIKKNGYTQPILVRKNPEVAGEYIIVDGEHRWVVMKNEPEFAGPQQVVVIETDEDLAKIQTINHNILRGEMDTVKMSAIIKDLMVTKSVEELEEDLGMTDTQIRDLEQLTNFEIEDLDDIALDELETSIVDEANKKNETSFSVIFNRAETALYEEMKKYLPKDVDTNNDIACIIKLIRIFLVSKGINISEIIKANTNSDVSKIGENNGPKISAPGTIEEEIISEEPVEPAI